MCRRISVLMTLAVAMALQSWSGVLAGGPNDDNQSDNIGWEAKFTIGGQDYTTCYVFLPHGVLVEISVPEGGKPRISTAFYELENGSLEVRWTNLIDGALVPTSSEKGQLKNTAQNGLSYSITDHSDKRQVGMNLDFRRTQMNRDEFNAMCRLAETYHQHKLKEIAHDQHMEVYKRELANTQNAIDSLLRR